MTSKPSHTLASAFCLLLALMTPQFANAQMATPLAYKVKAAFVFNFALFVEWPSIALAPAQKSVVLGVIGDDPLGDALESLRGKQVGGRVLEVVRLDTEQDPGRCHILYIGASERARMPTILKKLEGRSVLTVGDMPDFVSNGGMIGFFIEGESVRFEICAGRASRANLKLSAKLLQVAKPAACESP